MAKIGKVGASSDVSSVEIGSGLFVYCTDTGELYIDYDNSGTKKRGQVKMAGSAYVSGVTISGGNIKVTKGDGSSTSVSIGNYAGSSSNGGAANSVKSSLTVKLNGGTTEGTNQFTYNGSAAKSMNITPSSIGAAASSHTHSIANISGLQDELDGKLDATANAVSASKLATARTISLSGDASGSVFFDGSKDVAITVTVKDDSHAHTIANVDGLQTALDGKLASSANAVSATKLLNSRTFSITGGATAAGVAFNGTGNVALNVTSLDATKLSGIVPLDNLPAGALERLVTVEDQAARFDLTTSDVQLGDTVQQLDTGVMYLVVDTANLDSASGYKEYTAGSATSVPWSGVTGKPSTFTPSTHTHTIAQITSLQSTLDGKLSTSGTAAAATKLATARTITLSGDVTGSASFDGTKNITISTTVPDMKGASTSAAGTAGLVPAPATGSANRYLRSDATWAVPPNTTYSNMGGSSSSAAGTAGLVPAPAAGTSNRYLRCDGTWAVPPDTNTTYSTMTGSSSSAAGKSGLVPVPAAGTSNRYLRCDGTWAVPPDTNTTYSNMSGSTTSAAGKAGLVPAPSSGANNRYLRCDGTWAVPPDTNTTYTLSSFGITATAAELNKLDGVTVGATQINYLSGVTSNLQTQINNLSSRITTAQNTATTASNNASTALTNANAAKSVTDKYSAMLNIIGNGQ